MSLKDELMKKVEKPIEVVAVKKKKEEDDLKEKKEISDKQNKKIVITVLTIIFLIFISLIILGSYININDNPNNSKSVLTDTKTNTPNSILTNDEVNEEINGEELANKKNMIYDETYQKCIDDETMKIRLEAKEEVEKRHRLFINNMSVYYSSSYYIKVYGDYLTAVVDEDANRINQEFKKEIDSEKLLATMIKDLENLDFNQIKSKYGAIYDEFFKTNFDFKCQDIAKEASISVS